jgi:hypothetical protein
MLLDHCKGFNCSFLCSFPRHPLLVHRPMSVPEEDGPAGGVGEAEVVQAQRLGQGEPEPFSISFFGPIWHSLCLLPFQGPPLIMTLVMDIAHLKIITYRAIKTTCKLIVIPMG